MNQPALVSHQSFPYPTNKISFFRVHDKGRQDYLQTELERREAIKSKKKLLTTPTDNPNPLVLDCDSENFTGYACENYIVQSIMAYGKDGHYNIVTRPLLEDTEKMDVTLYVQLAEFLGLNFVDGSVQVSLYIDLYWNDELISWDSTKTDNINFVALPLNALWLVTFIDCLFIFAFVILLIINLKN